MTKYLLIGMIIVVITFGTYAIMPDALAHRDGCHRWHSCPSDTGSYTCGDTGYCSECPDNNYCKAGQPISFSYSSNSGTSNPPTTKSTTVTSHPTTSTTTASSPTPATPNPSPTTPSKIPSWVKSIFGYYAQGNISDDQLISAIQFLAKQGIIKIS